MLFVGPLPFYKDVKISRLYSGISHEKGICVSSTTPYGESSLAIVREQCETPQFKKNALVQSMCQHLLGDSDSYFSLPYAWTINDHDKYYDGVKRFRDAFYVGSGCGEYAGMIFAISLKTTST